MNLDPTFKFTKLAQTNNRVRSSNEFGPSPGDSQVGFVQCTTPPSACAMS